MSGDLKAVVAILCILGLVLGFFLLLDTYPKYNYLFEHRGQFYRNEWYELKADYEGIMVFSAILFVGSFVGLFFFLRKRTEGGKDE